MRDQPASENLHLSAKHRRQVSAFLFDEDDVMESSRFLAILHEKDNAEEGYGIMNFVVV